MTAESSLSMAAADVGDGADRPHERQSRSTRPKLSGRRTSGTMIVHRDSPNLELHDEVYDEDDARAMSPRRNSQEVEHLGREVRRALHEQAQKLQDDLRVLIDRVEQARCDYDKLEGENRFLQSYIGELMTTSKITSTGPGRSTKAGGRSK